MTNFTANFNSELSRAALDKVYTHPKWNEKQANSDYPCGKSYCYIEWCEILSGNYKQDKDSISQKTNNLMGLSDVDYKEFTHERNTLARLEAFHLLHTTGTFGTDGYDTDGFDRDGYDVKGNLPYVFVDRYRFDEYGLDRQGFDVKGVKPRLIDKYKSN